MWLNKARVICGSIKRTQGSRCSDDRCRHPADRNSGAPDALLPFLRGEKEEQRRTNKVIHTSLVSDSHSHRRDGKILQIRKKLPPLISGMCALGECLSVAFLPEDPTFWMWRCLCSFRLSGGGRYSTFVPVQTQTESSFENKQFATQLPSARNEARPLYGTWYSQTLSALPREHGRSSSAEAR